MNYVVIPEHTLKGLLELSLTQGHIIRSLDDAGDHSEAWMLREDHIIGKD